MADLINCDNNSITFEQAFSACLTKTTGGDVAVRAMFVDACATDAIDCSKSVLPLDQLLKSSIGIASCGKPALRLGVKPADLAAAFGAVAYADLTAANTALAAGVIFFNTALGKLDITTA